MPYERVKRIILETDDPNERKIRLAAILTSSLPKTGPRPVMVGGSAIEVYLSGTLRTGDMDIVYNPGALTKILRLWHFERASGSWANDELGLSVDAVGDSLNGSYDKTTTIVTKYGPATVIGMEDLILRRLTSAKHRRYPSDMEQAYLLAKAHGDRLDWEYIEEGAKKSRTTDYLRRLKRMVERGPVGRPRAR